MSTRLGRVVRPRCMVYRREAGAALWKEERAGGRCEDVLKKAVRSCDRQRPRQVEEDMRAEATRTRPGDEMGRLRTGTSCVVLGTDIYPSHAFSTLHTRLFAADRPGDV